MTVPRLDARSLHEAAFGRAPAGLWQAPGRVNLIGEHTDYNDGLVLPIAIDRTTTVAMHPRTDDRIRLVSTIDSRVVEVDLDVVDRRRFEAWTAYPLGVMWAISTHPGGSHRHGVDLAIHSDIPVGAGLSSSAALEMAVAVALSDIWELDLDRSDLARIGQRAENLAVGAPTGIMDQSASVFGQRDAAVFLDCRSLQVEPIPLGFDHAGLVLLVVDTKVQHHHATGGYRDRREACERGAAALGVPALRDLTVDDLPRAAQLLDDATYRRIRHVVTENTRVTDSVAALRARDLARFGQLMNASHRSMRDDFEISVPQLDTVVEAAQAAGALGARMTGGGFGGSAIALLPAGLADGVAKDIVRRFSDRGWTRPDTFLVTASDGAARLHP